MARISTVYLVMYRALISVQRIGNKHLEWFGVFPELTNWSCTRRHLRVTILAIDCWIGHFRRHFAIKLCIRMPLNCVVLCSCRVGVSRLRFVSVQRAADKRRTVHFDINSLIPRKPIISPSWFKLLLRHNIYVYSVKALAPINSTIKF